MITLNDESRNFMMAHLPQDIQASIDTIINSEYVYYTSEKVMAKRITDIQKMSSDDDIESEIKAIISTVPDHPVLMMVGEEETK